MRGSEKQVKWAEKIKSELSFDNCGNHPAVLKFASMIMANDDASWWIDNRNWTGKDMLYAACTGGFMATNEGSARTIEITKDLAITVRWRELVNNGDGGHLVERCETVDW